MATTGGMPVKVVFSLLSDAPGGGVTEEEARPAQVYDAEGHDPVAGLLQTVAPGVNHSRIVVFTCPARATSLSVAALTTGLGKAVVDFRTASSYFDKVEVQTRRIFLFYQVH